MPRWTAITETIVRTGKISALVDAVQGRADADAQADPLPQMIADVTATLRSAVSTGNALDSNTAKIPNSLLGLGTRMVVRRVKDHLDMEMTAAEQKQADEDRSYLNRIMDAKLKFETPDDADGSSEMNPSQPSIRTVEPDTTRRFTRGGMGGL